MFWDEIKKEALTVGKLKKILENIPEERPILYSDMSGVGAVKESRIIENYLLDDSPVFLFDLGI